MHFEFPALDPVLIDLPGPIDVRYFGLLFVLSFLAAWWILVRLARARFWPGSAGTAWELILWSVVGVVVGGRLGFALLYDSSLLNPARLVELWRGGISFHGGVLGVAVVLWVFARRRGLEFPRIMDCAALVVTPGIFLVGIANFINGDLYGKATSADTWGAMQFPTDRLALHNMGLTLLGDQRTIELGVQCAYGRVPWTEIRNRFPKTYPSGRPIAWEEKLDWAAVRRHRDLVPFRHPTQLYEAVGEGLLLGLILGGLYRATRATPLAAGGYCAWFLVGAGALRFGLEFLRDPAQSEGDAAQTGGLTTALSTGQVLCAFMILIGGFILSRRRRSSGSDGR